MTDTSTNRHDSLRRRASVAGVAVTLLFHALLVVVLMVLWLRYSPADLTERTWPPVDSSEVLFGGEYVMTGDIPVNNPADDTPQGPAASAESSDTDLSDSSDASDLTDASDQSAAAPVLTASAPAPAKTVKPETSSPTQAEIDAARRREQQQREQQVRADVASKMKFGKGSSSQSSPAPSQTPGGKPGQTNGNSDTGALSGQPGVSLHGRTLASWQQPAAGPMGTITIRVTVNRQGRVTEAAYSSGTGPAATSTSARSSCLAAARASRFSVDATAPASQTGTITYHFR